MKISDTSSWTCHQPAYRGPSEGSTEEDATRLGQQGQDFRRSYGKPARAVVSRALASSCRSLFHDRLGSLDVWKRMLEGLPGQVSELLSRFYILVHSSRGVGSLLAQL